MTYRDDMTDEEVEQEVMKLAASALAKGDDATDVEKDALAAVGRRMQSLRAFEDEIATPWQQRIGGRWAFRRTELVGAAGFSATLAALAWLLMLLPTPFDYLSVPAWGVAAGASVAFACELAGFRNPTIRGMLEFAAFSGVVGWKIVIG